MAKRYTPNQLEYLKQIRRIRKALSALRRQGYDVSELAHKYTNELPKRVTEKTIEKLKATKPKDLKKEATYIGFTPKKSTPLQVKPTDYNADTVTYLPPSTQPLAPSSFILTPQEETLFEQPVVKEEDITTPTEPPYQEPTEYIPEIETEYETYPEEYEEVYNEEYIPEEPVVPEEPQIDIIETDTEVIYVDTTTGEIIDRVTRIDKSDVIDLSEIAIENLRELASHFSPQVSENINNIIDKMIQQKGTKAVADAFTEQTQERPSLLQLLSSAYTKYKAMALIVSDLCERLEIPDMSREIMRDIVTRESMSDMDEYL